MSNDEPKVVKTTKVKEPASEQSDVMDMLRGISEGMQSMRGDINAVSNRLSKIEKGDADDFKIAAKSEDVAAANEMRRKVDPRICTIVDELLGEDFGIAVDGFPDRPGYLFTLIVPNRLSDNVRDKRPKLDPKGGPGAYVKDSMGEVVLEDYIPEDRRSRSIGSAENFDAIRKHCELVRSYIVSSFQKMSKPLPEFKVK